MLGSMGQLGSTSYTINHLPSKPNELGTPNPPTKPQKGILSMLRRMNAKELDIPDWLRLSPECVALVRRLLEPDPQQRITISGVMQVRAGFTMGVGWARASFLLLFVMFACRR